VDRDNKVEKAAVEVEEAGKGLEIRTGCHMDCRFLENMDRLVCCCCPRRYH